jgi:tRNA nucleotidyltransferase/poly(A) polymerase
MVENHLIKVTVKKENMKNYKNYIKENILNQEMPIPNDVEQIANAFHKAGKDLFVVGGAVRDHLQGKEPHDYDLVTNALPDETKEILKDWNVSDEQGANFGVLRVYTEDEPLGHEIATYRKDIKNNVIRTVGKPEERFAEDRLRILRVFRFTARTGGEIDPITSEAIKKDNRLRGINAKEDVSQERIHEEWNKVIEHAEKGGLKIMEDYIYLLSKYNMWEQMFPNTKITTDPDIIDVEVLDSSIIFFDLFHREDINKRRKHFIETLKFKTDIVDEMHFFQEYWKTTYFGGEEKYNNVYRLALLKQRFSIDNDLLRRFMQHKDRRVPQKKFLESFIKYCDDGFVVDGRELMKQGFKGKEIGVEKERLENERFKNQYI